MKEIAKDSGGGKFSSRMGIARPQLEKTEVKESSTHIDQDHTITMWFFLKLSYNTHFKAFLRWRTELLLDWNLSTVSALQPSSQLPEWNR